jgi:hypothetical protein
MKTKENNLAKRIYLNPSIEFILIDNEISLALQSEPPVGPGESLSLIPEFVNNNPLKATMG